MVRVALAGASGTVGREILAELIRQGKHELAVLSRKGNQELTDLGVNVAIVDYNDQADLARALKGIQTVLSFIGEKAAQLTLIAACVKAGVKRYAPTEWAMSSEAREPGSEYKDEIHTHLKNLNAEKPVLEFTLFQPGVFTNVVVWPRKTAEYLYTTCIGIDIDGGHALMVEDGGQDFTFTTVHDTAKVVASAIEYEGPWPEFGGIAGSQLKYGELLDKIEQDTGKPLERHVLRMSDLQQGKFESTWLPPYRHPMIPLEMADAFAMQIMTQWWRCAGGSRNSAVVPTWNELLPEMKLTDVDTFLTDVYGKSESQSHPQATKQAIAL
ncbi:hypothetical protein MMC18_000994 [Xylographa bjoerkii]|nr:hypothetical protein [Xylographa bjoerkii]